MKVTPALGAFAETNFVVFADALRVGTPAFVSHTGGYIYMLEEGNTCPFIWSGGDEAMCACQVEKLLANEEVALRR